VTSFSYNNDELFAEGVSLTQLQQQFGSPLYVYSRAELTKQFTSYQQGLGDNPGLICYAVKANSNIAVLNVLAKLGAGFDIVSKGELERVMAAGADPKKVVFSGVAKREHEMVYALELGIHCFNVESEAELDVLNRVAGEQGKVAPVSIRVNPDVDAQTHPYISTGLKENKFGIDINLVESVYQRAANMDNIEICGIDCHIGSQLTETKPFLAALERVLGLYDTLAAQGIGIKHLDLGGGLGVTYDDEVVPTPKAYVETLRAQLGDRKVELIFEPGRSIAANAGVMLTEVVYLKSNEEKNFAIVDAAMNDLIRPALYQAWQEIVPVALNKGRDVSETKPWDLVGPICETGDFIGKDRQLNLQAGDVLAVKSSGAYGFVMSSNYNSRGRAAEVMVDGDQAYLVRQRETEKSLFELESLLP
jgi:diaminopimelate decarboxylase